MTNIDKTHVEYGETIGSTRIRHGLNQFEIKSRIAERRDLAWLAGSIGIAAVGETTAVPEGLELGLISLIVVGSMRTAFQLKGRANRRHRMEANLAVALKNERLNELLPAHSSLFPNESMKNGLQSAFDQAKKMNNETTDQTESLWREVALHQALDKYLITNHLSGFEQGLAAVVMQMIRAQNSNSLRGHIELNIIAETLDGCLPIDQQREELTPPDPLTGQKTWLGYISALESNYPVQYELRQNIL